RLVVRPRAEGRERGAAIMQPCHEDDTTMIPEPSVPVEQPSVQPPGAYPPPQAQQQTPPLAAAPGSRPLYPPQAPPYVQSQQRIQGTPAYGPPPQGVYYGPPSQQQQHQHQQQYLTPPPHIQVVYVQQQQQRSAGLLFATAGAGALVAVAFLT